MKITKTLGAAVIFSTLTASSSFANAQSIEWTSGAIGGSWFAITTGLSGIVMDEIDDLNIRIVPGGGKDNPSKINAGISQLGMGIDFLSAAALEGQTPYDSPHPSLTTLGKTWMTAQFHVIVDADETRDLGEILSDPKIMIGTSSPATSEALTLQRILEYYDNDINTVRSSGGKVTNSSYSQLVSAFQNGQVDVVFAAGGAPTGVALEIEAGRRNAKLIPFTDELMNHLTNSYGYSTYSIPSDTYEGLQAESSSNVMVSAMGTIILADATLPEELVYNMMTSILNNKDKFNNITSSLSDFNAHRAWKDLPIPLHPGAEKAYRDLGYME